MNDCRTHTSDFLNSVTRQVWGIELPALSASEAIGVNQCRELLVAAEVALQNGRLLEACRNASKGIEVASNLAGARMFGYGMTLDLWQLRSYSVDSPLADFGRKVADELRKIHEQLLDVALALDRTDRARLNRLAGYNLATTAGDEWTEPTETVDQAGAEWAIAYSTEAIMQIEDRLGPLDEDDR